MAGALVFFSYLVLVLFGRQVSEGCPEASVPLPGDMGRMTLALAGLAFLTVVAAPKNGALAGLVSGAAVAVGALCMLGGMAPYTLQKGTLLFLLISPLAVGALLGAAQKTLWYETTSAEIVGNA